MQLGRRAPKRRRRTETFRRLLERQRGAADYASRLFRAIDRVRFYPSGSRDRGEEGRVVLRVMIGADGRLLDAYIASGSGYPELAAATIEMARRASPYPPLPRGLGAERASFNVPIIFGIRFRR